MIYIQWTLEGSTIVIDHLDPNYVSTYVSIYVYVNDYYCMYIQALVSGITPACTSMCTCGGVQVCVTHAVE